MQLGQGLISLFYKGVSLKYIQKKKKVSANVKRENNFFLSTCLIVENQGKEGLKYSAISSSLVNIFPPASNKEQRFSLPLLFLLMYLQKHFLLSFPEVARLCSNLDYFKVVKFSKLLTFLNLLYLIVSTSMFSKPKMNGIVYNYQNNPSIGVKIQICFKRFSKDFIYIRIARSIPSSKSKLELLENHNLVQRPE